MDFNNIDANEKRRILEMHKKLGHTSALLTENLINEAEKVDLGPIQVLLSRAALGPGTNIQKLNQAFDLIGKLPDGSHLVTLNKGIANQNYGYSDLKDLLLGELENDNYPDLLKYIEILNKIPGIKASQDFYNKDKSKKIVISYQPAKTNAQNTKVGMTIAKLGDANLKRLYDGAPQCLKYLMDSKASGVSGKVEYQKPPGNKNLKYSEGVWITYSTGTMLFFSVIPQIVANVNDQWASYKCDGDKMIRGTFGTIEDAIASSDMTPAVEIVADKDGNKTDQTGDNTNQQTVSNIGNTEQDLEAGKVIGRGSRGDFVKQIQQRLFQIEGYAYMFLERLKDKSKTPLDGRYGPTTQRVVKQYQYENGIKPANGQVNKATWEKIKTIPWKNITYDTQQQKSVYTTNSNQTQGTPAGQTQGTPARPRPSIPDAPSGGSQTSEEDPSTKA